MEDYPDPRSRAYAADPRGNAHLATDGTVQKVLNDIAKAVQALLARSNEDLETQRAIMTAYEEWRGGLLQLFARKPGARVEKGWGVWAGYCVKVELQKLLEALELRIVLENPRIAVNRLDPHNHLNRTIHETITSADRSLKNARLNHSPDIPEYLSIPEVHLVTREGRANEGPHIKEEPPAEEDPHPRIKRESPEVNLHLIPLHPSQLHSMGRHALLNRFSLRQQRLYRL